jgi:hypothetical protein
MILAVLTWITVLISSITSSLIEDLNNIKENGSNKLNIYKGQSIEMTVIPNTRSTPAKRALRRIKSFSPRSGMMQPNLFKNFAPVPISIDPIKGVDDEYENDSLLSMSSVSESFLEDLGLRSRPSTPSLPSPSQKLSKIASFPSLSSTFYRKRRKSEEFQSSSEDFSSESSGLENDQFESDKVSNYGFVADYQFDFIEIDDDYGSYNNESKKARELELIESESKQTEIETMSQVQAEEKKSSLILSNFPDFLLARVFEYCSDASMLEIRLVDKKFNNACNIYLKFLENLTLNPSEAAEFSFESKYHLSSTMMPFYKNQPQIRDMISPLLLNIDKPWNLMSLNDLLASKTFKRLKIFSNDFIKEIIIPQLDYLSRNPPTATTTEPSPIFLFGEALLKSKRFGLFDEQVLPILNRISMEMFTGIPATEYLSPNYLNLADDQKVLGATLHMVINYNLNYSVKHLVKLQVDVLNSKNHCGVTALLKIIEYLGQNCVPVEVDEEDIENWIKGVNLKFSQGILIQQNFPNNSFLAFEMFLGILNQVSEIFENREEAISFLGFNQEYKIIVRIPNGNHYIRYTTLLHELIKAQQYDLIYTLGFHYGDLIQSQQDTNPLHMAAEVNDPALVSILLNFYPQIDVNSLTSSGQTAIGLVAGKQMRSLKVLLNDPRADPNLHNSVSPLIRMIEVGNMETVKLLLNHHSIDINHQIIKNSKVSSPLGAVVTWKKWDFLYLLLRCPNSKLNIDQDPMVIQNLKVAEKALMKFEERYRDLIMMVKKLILPTIQE